MRDEVDKLLESPSLSDAVKRPDLAVPRHSRRVHVGRVDDAEQVLQPELPAVLRVVAGALDVEEQVPGDRLRQGEQPPVRHELTGRVALRRKQLVLDGPRVLARHLQPGLLLGASQGPPAHAAKLRQLVKRREPAPRRDPRGLQPAPLPRGHPRDQREVVVAPPAVLAPRPPPADRAVLDRLGIGEGPGVVRDDLGQPPPGLPLEGGVVADLQRRELTAAERQVHPARLYLLSAGKQVRVEAQLGDGARLRRPGELRVYYLVMRPGGRRFPVRRRQQPGPHQEVGPAVQGRPVALAGEQHPLVHDVGPGFDGGDRRPRGVTVRRSGNLADAPAPGREAVKHHPLVRLPARHQVLEANVELARWPELPARRQHVQPCQVAAREKVRDITRRQPQPARLKLHSHQGPERVRDFVLTPSYSHDPGVSAGVRVPMRRTRSCAGAAMADGERSRRAPRLPGRIPEVRQLNAGQAHSLARTSGTGTQACSAVAKTLLVIVEPGDCHWAVT